MEKTFGSPATDTVYFGGRPIARTTGGAWTDLVYGPSGLLAEVPGTQAGQPTYRLLDHLGSEAGTIDPGGIGHHRSRRHGQLPGLRSLRRDLQRRLAGPLPVHRQGARRGDGAVTLPSECVAHKRTGFGLSSGCG